MQERIPNMADSLSDKGKGPSYNTRCTRCRQNKYGKADEVAAWMQTHNLEHKAARF